MILDIHSNVKQKLNAYIENATVPHLIFHGPSGCGKRTIVNWFLKQIYNNHTQNMNDYIMYVDCAHGKGIKFIREQIKFFAKTNLNITKETPFKSIVLSNADKLTTDAQSALRRLIEVFSHSTRFFVIVEDKYRMLLPILSRLGDIYIPLPVINCKETNLNKLLMSNINVISTEEPSSLNVIIEATKPKIIQDPHRKISKIIKRHLGISSEIATTSTSPTTTISQDDTNEPETLLTLVNATHAANELYENAFSGIDVIEYLQNRIPQEYRSKFLLMFDKMRIQYRSEPLLITTLLYNTLVRSNHNFVNIGFM